MPIDCSQRKELFFSYLILLYPMCFSVKPWNAIRQREFYRIMSLFFLSWSRLNPQRGPQLNPAKLGCNAAFNPSTIFRSYGAGGTGGVNIELGLRPQHSDLSPFALRPLPCAHPSTFGLQPSTFISHQEANTAKKIKYIDILASLPRLNPQRKPDSTGLAEQAG